MTEAANARAGFWSNRTVIAILVVAVIAVTVAVPGVGALGAFAIVIVAAVLAIKQNSSGDLGFRSPGFWPNLLATTFAYGVVLQLVMLAVVEPLIMRWTGTEIDLSAVEGVRGNFVNFAILMAIGWVVGGFLEEMTYRGFVMGRVRWLLGSGTAATWAGVLVGAIPFGLAHAYQGPAGMITTGLTGFIVGAILIRHRFNLWYAIFTHGFINTVGIVAIYLDLDRQISQLVQG